MTDFTEKRYSIDPGKGKKMAGCPYSIYEDGRDVKDYIIPPKGHVFVGFRYDPDASNQIYDGKLTAEYAKEPFNARIKSNLWKLILVLAIVLVIGIVMLLVFSIFKDPKTNTPKQKEVKPKTEIVDKKKAEKTPAENTVSEPKQPSETAPAQVQPEVKAPVEEQPATTVSTVEQNTSDKQSQQPATTDPNEVFKREFWGLVHEKSGSMDAYTDLYNEYKTKVAGEEFDYLRYTILKDYVNFKAWYDKLKKIPEKELSSIKTIETLKKSVG